ncbi:MAG: hypothetical protein GWP19_14655 [Planctomycetia bacterium]|nr:hypothetical protein [Planctomycetia bacterium]
MSYIQLPAKTSSDLNASADINQLQENIEALKGGSGGTPPTTDIESMALLLGSLSYQPGDYDILDDDGFGKILFSGGSSNSKQTLPTLADNQGRIITCYNADTTFELNVDGEGAEPIGGMTDIDLPKKGNYITVIGTSSEWKIINENITCIIEMEGINGFGSGNLKCIEYTGFNKQFGNLITIASDSVNGTIATVAKSGVYGVNAMRYYNGGAEVGIVRNATAGERDLRPSSIAQPKNIGVGIGSSEGAVFIGHLEDGDILTFQCLNTPTDLYFSMLFISYLGAN